MWSRNRAVAVSASAAAALLLTLASARPARAQVVLYDGALNTDPSAQGWSYQAFPGPGGETASVSVGGGATTLNTTGANGIQAGYSRIAPFVLDRTTGFTLDFDVKLLSEAHATNDRAGFSLIALSNDKKGIELGFWTDQVWAQNDTPLFTHGESAAFDTTAAGSGAAGTTRYRLSVLGDNYSLFQIGAGGAATPLLENKPLRDYSAFVGPIDPYETPNFLFVGDDTTSARGSVQIARFEASPFAVVPEPGTLGLLGMAGSTGLLSRLRQRRRRA